MRPPVNLIVCAIVVSLAAWCHEARAEEATRASSPLVFRGCESGERREIGRLVALDLASSDALAQPEAASLALTCLQGRFEIEIVRSSNQTLSRSIDLQQLPARARSRIVAIAIVELLAADPAEVTPTPGISVSVSAPNATTRPTPSSSPRPIQRMCCSAQLGAVTSARIFPAGAAPLLGAGLRVDITPGSLAWDALAEFGTHRVSQGSTHLTLLSSSLSAGWATAPGVASLRLAMGVRAGVVGLSGEPLDPSRLSGRSSWRGWGGPKLEANLTLSPSVATRVRLTAESGYALLSVYAAGPTERDAELHGVWLGLQLSVGLGW